jgi:hypothetical protein
MSNELFGEDDFLSRAAHPSDPFRWIRRYAAHDAVVWAIELTDLGRRRHLLDLASRGPISDLDHASLARFAALVIVMQDRRSLGLV